MDIAELKPTESILDIVHPSTGERLGITITLLSLDDERMKKVKRQIHDRALNLQKKGKTFKSEEIEDNGNELLFTAMTGWTWGIPTDEKGVEIPDATPATFRGSVPPFNKPSVYAVFNALPWLRDQVDEKVSDTKSFFQP
jgi:hypothetical protein